MHETIHPWRAVGVNVRWSISPPVRASGDCAKGEQVIEGVCETNTTRAAAVSTRAGGLAGPSESGAGRTAQRGTLQDGLAHVRILVTRDIEEDVPRSAPSRRRRLASILFVEGKPTTMILGSDGAGASGLRVSGHAQHRRLERRIRHYTAGVWAEVPFRIRAKGRCISKGRQTRRGAARGKNTPFVDA